MTMNNSTVAYCRLCAVLKPVSRLSNLADDEENAQMIVNKLSRFNIAIEFNASILPKMVCCVCTRSLDQAFTFITTVEKAQASLSDYILVKIKRHDTESDDKNIFNEPSDENQPFKYDDELGMHNNVRTDITTDNNIYVEIKPCINDMEDVKNLSTNDKLAIKIGNDDHHSVNHNKMAINVECSLTDYALGNDNGCICAVNDVGNIEDSNIKIENSNKELAANNQNDMNEHSKIEIDQNETKEIIDPPKIKCKCTKQKSLKGSYLMKNEPSADVINANNKNYFMAVDETIKVFDNNRHIVNQNTTAESIEKEDNVQETKKSVIPTKVKRKYTKHKSTKVLEPEITEYSPDYINKQIKRLAAIPVQEITKTWIEYSWKCFFCETLFPNIQELRTHSMEYHGCCNPYICTEGCQGRKFRLNRFLKHVHHHNKYLHYSCYLCFEKFSNPLQTRKHKRTHINTDFVCQGCNTSYPSKAELSEHEVKYFQKFVRTPLKDQNFTCSICKKTLRTRTGFIYHMDAHNTDRKRQYVCDICGKGFLVKSYLAEHIIHHFDARPHQCVICKQAFKTLNKLRYHARVHSEVKPFTCDQCGKCFRLKLYLTNHLITHSNDLPYSCTHCNKKFRTSTFLKNHSRQHTGVKPYTCEICSRNFTNWSNYNKHMKRKHGIDKTKRKRTPQGPHAVDPVTGEIIQCNLDITNRKGTSKYSLNQVIRSTEVCYAEVRLV